jgi:hypothetical protein
MSREAFQEPQTVAIKTAKSSLLQARGRSCDPAGPCSEQRGARVRTPAALPPQRIDLERTDAIDLGRDRGRLSPAPAHNQTPGRATAESDSMAPGSSSECFGDGRGQYAPERQLARLVRRRRQPWARGITPRLASLPRSRMVTDTLSGRAQAPAGSPACVSHGPADEPPEFRFFGASVHCRATGCVAAHPPPPLGEAGGLTVPTCRPALGLSAQGRLQISTCLSARSGLHKRQGPE